MSETAAGKLREWCTHELGCSNNIFNNSNNKDSISSLTRWKVKQKTNADLLKSSRETLTNGPKIHLEKSAENNDWIETNTR